MPLAAGALGEASASDEPTLNWDVLHHVSQVVWVVKDVDRVVEVCHRAGLSRKVARLRPLAVVKG